MEHNKKIQDLKQEFEKIQNLINQIEQENSQQNEIPVVERKLEIAEYNIHAMLADRFIDNMQNTLMNLIYSIHRVYEDKLKYFKDEESNLKKIIADKNFELDSLYKYNAIREQWLIFYLSQLINIEELEWISGDYSGTIQFKERNLVVAVAFIKLLHNEKGYNTEIEKIEWVKKPRTELEIDFYTKLCRRKYLNYGRDPFLGIDPIYNQKPDGKIGVWMCESCLKKTN